MRNNKGQFEKGHESTLEEKEKIKSSLKKSWVNRSDYHGMYGTGIYNSWRSMTTRCRGTAGEGSKIKYLNKGTTVCERWLDFKNFYEDMKDGHSDGLTIDRIENDKGYYKENCRWATQKQQQNNRTNSIRIEYLGETKTLSEWADHLQINFTTLRNRYYKPFIKGKTDINHLFRK